MSEAAPVARAPTPRSRQEEAEDLIPLPASWFYALWALAEDGPLHGYAIVRKFKDETALRIKMGPGNTYRSLFAMVELGLIERVRPPERVDRRRSYYRIASPGAKAFEAQVGFMEEELRWARASLALNGADRE